MIKIKVKVNKNQKNQKNQKNLKKQLKKQLKPTDTRFKNSEPRSIK
jgi:hypothetical protein